jgi:hypothetical protein
MKKLENTVEIVKALTNYTVTPLEINLIERCIKLDEANFYIELGKNLTYAKIDLSDWYKIQSEVQSQIRELIQKIINESKNEESSIHIIRTTEKVQELKNSCKKLCSEHKPANNLNSYSGNKGGAEISF